MKTTNPLTKNPLLVALCLITCLMGCYPEDPITTELGKDVFTPTENATEYDQAVLDFFEKYGSKVSHNEQTGLTEAYYHYRFLKSSKSLDERILVYQTDKDILLEGLNIFKELFVDVYTEDFGKAYFPRHIFLLDSVIDLYWEEHIDEVVEVSLNTSYIAINRNRENGIKDYSEYQKERLKIQMHRLFWVNYMLALKSEDLAPPDFFAVSKENYNKDFPSETNYRDLGFFFFNTSFYSYFDDLDVERTFIRSSRSAPDKEQDLEDFLEVILYNPSTDLKPVLDEYPKLKQKYCLLVNSLKETYNFDPQSISGNETPIDCE